MSSQVWDNFMNSDFAKETLKSEVGLKKQAQAAGDYGHDRSHDELYGVGDLRDEVAAAHPGGGTNTEQVVSGGGSHPLGDKSFSKQYDVGNAMLPGGDGAKVETVSEQHATNEGIARKQPTGQPLNQPGIEGLNWAQANNVRGLSKNSNSKRKEVIAKKKTALLLNELIKIADMLEDQGLFEEAEEIDSIIKDEVGVTTPGENQNVGVAPAATNGE